jgi:hypothetical protein
MAETWRWFGAVRSMPENGPETEKYAAEKTQTACRIAGQASKFWNYGQFRR